MLKFVVIGQYYWKSLWATYPYKGRIIIGLVAHQNLIDKQIHLLMIAVMNILIKQQMKESQPLLLEYLEVSKYHKVVKQKFPTMVLQIGDIEL